MLKKIFKVLHYITIFVVLCIVFFFVWALVRERNNPKDVAPSDGQFVTTSLGDMYVRTKGDSKNQSIVLIHGMAAWSGTWDKSAEYLSDKGYYVVALDMPPFGFSERPQDGDYSRTGQAKSIVEVIRNLNLSQPILVGHSYGSRATLEAVMQYEDEIKGLVLVAAALDRIYNPEEAEISSSRSSFVINIASFQPIRGGLVAVTLSNPFLSKFFLQKFIYDPEDATDEVVDLYRKPATVKGSTLAVSAWLIDFLKGDDYGLTSVRANYKKISIPTFIIWGDKDTVTPLSQGEMLQGLIPNSELRVISGVGHIPQIEDSHIFNATLLDVLKSY